MQGNFKLNIFRISYSCVLEISAGFGQSVVNKYQEVGVVYPRSAREGILLVERLIILMLIISLS